MGNTSKDLFKYLLVISIICYVCNYTLIVVGLVGARHSVMLDATVYACFFFFYMWKYRRHNLLCFELMAMPIGFIGMFFLDIILPSIPELMRFYDISDVVVKEKSATLQMIAWLTFLLGSVIAHNKYKGVANREEIKSSESRINYNALVNLFSIFLLLLIIYDYYSGIFDSWFFYSNMDTIDRNERNVGLGHLLCLMLPSLVAEVVRLRNIGVNNLMNFIKKCNKLLIIEWIFISSLLFVSGNRNEMLLIVLPLVVSYSKCINQISNKILLLAVSVGIILMVFVGTSRQEGVSADAADFGVASFFIDFSELGYDCDYLVKYSDQQHHASFGALPGYLLSGIPFFGPKMLELVEYMPPKSSSRLCTDSVGAISGLGTSLIGDLYYEAGFLWVLIYMFGFGYLMSRWYNLGKNINKYLLIFYSYMVANAVYYVRSQWGLPIGTLGYSAILLILGETLFQKKRK